MIGDDAERDVDVERQAFAIHGQEDGRITGRQRRFGHTMIFVADYQACFIRVVKLVVRGGIVDQFDGDDLVALLAQSSNGDKGVGLVAPGDTQAFVAADFLYCWIGRCGGDAGQDQLG